MRYSCAQIASGPCSSIPLKSTLQAIAQPLNSLIKSLVIPPELIYLIRDTVPNTEWIPAIAQLEQKIWAVRARGKVRASHEVAMVVEGLKAKVSRRWEARRTLSINKDSQSLARRPLCRYDNICWA